MNDQMVLEAPAAAPNDPVKQFLDALFAGKEPGEFLLIWLRDGRRSAWFQDIAKAAEYVRANADRDVYCGVSLSPADHGPHLRLKIESNERPPSSLSALYADLDIADQAHHKTNLPPNEVGAMSILFPGLPPSIVVHSGGGLQAWWLLKEPWILDSTEEIQKAGALSKRWVRALRARAAAKGWDVDQVGDLTRVLRVAGTTNTKIPGQPRPVVIREINDHRYNQSDLEEYLDQVGAERVSSAIHLVAPARLQYAADAEPPAEKFAALRENDAKFKQTWEHTRKDLKDQSASSYDMSLADTAVQALWSDQEIANLLIAHRRRYNEDLKLRDSYYAKTIARARQLFPNLDALLDLDSLPEPDSDSDRDEDGERKASGVDQDPAQLKAALCDRISLAFGMVGKRRIVRITRYMSEPREYGIEIASGECYRLGPVQNLIDPHLLQAKIVDLAYIAIPDFKKNATWAKIRKMLIDACVDVSAGDEGTDAGLTSAWLREYLSAHKTMEEFNETDETRSPFLRDGCVHIFLNDFRRWIYIKHGDRLAQKEIGIKLRTAGARPVPIRYGPGDHSTRQAWKLPASFREPNPAGNMPADAPSWVAEDERIN